MRRKTEKTWCILNSWTWQFYVSGTPRVNLVKEMIGQKDNRKSFPRDSIRERGRERREEDESISRTARTAVTSGCERDS